MIDIHTHLLPGIDDGPRSVERPAKVLERFAKEGVSDVVLTPHARSSDFALNPENPFEKREVALEQLVEVAPQSPRLHLGFEILMNQPLPAALRGGRRLSLAGSRYVLVEFYKSAAAESIRKALEMISQTGMVPVVAHVERYHSSTPDDVLIWREAGAKMQVDAVEYLKDSKRGRTARLLTSLGLIDLAASDNHGGQRTLYAAKQFFEESGFEYVGRLVCETNPRAVLEDREMVDVGPVKLIEGLWSRVKRALGA